MKALFAALGLAGALFANDAGKSADPTATVFDAKSAFEYLKSLAGDWQKLGNEKDHDGSAVSFRVTAAGSTVIQTYGPGQPHEMISVYHLDGDQLLMTHYCSLKNAPKMKFEKTGRPGEIKWAFNGGTNFDPQVDAHAHEGLLRAKGPDAYEATAIGWAGGKAGTPRVSVMKRKK